MIIECTNCHKKFNIDSQLIPDNGRTLQCGSCKNTWFFKISPENIMKKEDKKVNTLKFDNINDPDDFIDNKDVVKNSKKTEKALVKYQKNKKSFLSIFFSYFIVAIISFIALILVLDTFENDLIKIYPDLELILYNLFETIKDIILFIKDLN